MKYSAVIYVVVFVITSKDSNALKCHYEGATKNFPGVGHDKTLGACAIWSYNPTSGDGFQTFEYLSAWSDDKQDAACQLYGSQTVCYCRTDLCNSAFPADFKARIQATPPEVECHGVGAAECHGVCGWLEDEYSQQYGNYCIQTIGKVSGCHKTNFYSIIGGEWQLHKNKTVCLSPEPPKPSVK